jgi:UDP-N-acetylmuramyl pentapeptide phosphotransferase/UDP-N-acetylglucosamine-1-phosphate transferase
MTSGLLRRSALAAAGVLAARAALRAAESVAAGRLDRTNFRGEAVSLAAGPALAVAASATAAAGAGNAPAAAAALVAGLGAGAVGRYDDLVGARPEQKAAKGFAGHLGALREGRVTAGLVKIVGVGTAAAIAAALLPDRSGGGRRVTDVLLGAGVIAGSANLVNLLDLRPGRALKAGLAVAAPLAGLGSPMAAGPAGAAAALLPDDLGERVMLGDCGANALGALVGLALVARTGRVGRVALLAGLAGAAAASERISFTKVIDGTPALRWLDQLGRR